MSRANKILLSRPLSVFQNSICIGCFGRGRAEVPIGYIFNPLHQDINKTLRNLTLPVSPPVNKENFLFPILKKKYLILSARPIPMKAFLFLESEVILVSITNQKIYRDSANASDQATVHRSIVSSVVIAIVLPLSYTPLRWI